jgi:hypothetical protein
MAQLLWEHQGQVIKDYHFPRGSVTIGRRKENSIVFTNPEVSSSHARIDKVGPDYILTDLQSTNGTLVNGLKVLSHRLSHGDRISIGKNVLLFIGTEKSKVEAERANIPLNQTVIIGGPGRRKKAPPGGVKTEPHYLEPIPTRNYLGVIVVSFILVGTLAVLGFFALKDSAFLTKGSKPKTNPAQRTESAALPPSTEGGDTSQEGGSPLPGGSESPRSMPLSQDNAESGDLEGPSVNIEAIVWSNDPRNSFVLINGAEFRVGDSVEGKKLARIERDRVVLQSQEGEFVVRLQLK